MSKYVGLSPREIKLHSEAVEQAVRWYNGWSHLQLSLVLDGDVENTALALDFCDATLARHLAV